MKLVLKKLRMERLSSSGKAGFGLGLCFVLVFSPISFEETDL